MASLCTCSAEAGHGEHATFRPPCCCLKFCTCDFTQMDSSGNKCSRERRPRSSTCQRPSEDKQTHGRCLSCLPEQMLIHEDEIANRQRHCRAVRTLLSKKKKALADGLLQDQRTASYHSNISEMLRLSSSRYYRDLSDREFKSRLQQLQQELRQRQREYAQRDKPCPVTDICEPTKSENHSKSNLRKPPPASDSPFHRKSHALSSPRRNRFCRCSVELPSPSTPTQFQDESANGKFQFSSPIVLDRVPGKFKPAHSTPRDAEASHASPRRHSGVKLVQPEYKRLISSHQGDKMPSGCQRGTAPAGHGSGNLKDTRGPCPCCGNPLMRASTLEIVSLLARGRVENFSRCISCDFVAGKLRPIRSKMCDPPRTASNSGRRRSRSASSFFLNSPHYGRKILITDDSYLQLRSKLFSEWERCGAIERISETRRSLSASCAYHPKWRTIDFKSIEAF